MRVICANFVLILTCFVSVVTDGRAGEHQDRFERVASQLVEAMRDEQVPGASLGIVHGENTSVRGFGITNIDHPLEVTPDTLFQIGSISKTFTATLIMRLVEEGKIDLDAAVRTYLPDFHVADERASEKVRMIDLLTHTSGWFGDLFVDTGRGDDALEKMIVRMQDLPQVTPFRSDWSYCNSGFYVAGRIVEVVTGQPFDQAMQQRVLTPLGMEQTYLRPADVMVHRFAVGHSGQGAKLTIAKPWALARAAEPAGSVTCSMRDLLRYARFHLGDGPNQEKEPLISPEGLTSMQRPHEDNLTPPYNTLFHTADGDPTVANEKIGITWFTGKIGPHTYVHHGGATNGQNSLLLLFPDERLAVAVCTNGSGGRRVGQQVVRAAMAEYLDIKTENPRPLAEQPADLSPYLGEYGNPFTHMQVRNNEGELEVRMILQRGFPDEDAEVPPPTPWAPATFIAADMARVTSGPLERGTISFQRDEAGKPDRLDARLRVHPKLSDEVPADASTEGSSPGG